MNAGAGRGPTLAWGLALACGLALGAPSAEAACTGRPTDVGHPYSYGVAAASSFPAGAVRVHYARSGPHAPDLASTRPDSVPDTVVYAAETGEAALGRYAALGFRTPPSDLGCPSNGGDDKIDVYLVRFSGADGATTPECSGAICPAYVLAESTFAGKGYADAREGFRTVVAHELFHVVQNAYRSDMAPFWAEGTAQWAMKSFDPSLRDFERQLPAFFAETSRSIDAAPSGVTAGFLYGSAVWPLFLTSTQSPSIVRETLELLATGLEPLDAVDAVLAKTGTSLAEVYPRFSLWNAATGTLAGTGGYPDAAAYPGVKVANLVDGVTAISSGLGAFAYRGTLSEMAEITLETEDARNAGFVAPFDGGKPALERAQKLPATMRGEVLVVVSGTTTKKTDARFTIRLLAPGATAPTGPTSPTSSSGGCRAASSPAERPAAIVLFVGIALAQGVRRRRSPVR